MSEVHWILLSKRGHMLYITQETSTSSGAIEFEARRKDRLLALTCAWGNTDRVSLSVVFGVSFCSRPFSRPPIFPTFWGSPKYVFLKGNPLKTAIFGTLAKYAFLEAATAADYKTTRRKRHLERVDNPCHPEVLCRGLTEVPCSVLGFPLFASSTPYRFRDLWIHGF